MNPFLLLCSLSFLLLSFGACGNPPAAPGTTPPEQPAPSPEDGDSADQASPPEQPAPPEEPSSTPNGDLPTPAEILEALGAEGVEGADPDAVAGYRGMYQRLDANGDSVVTVEEYIDAGHFTEEKARAIFAATDRDQDGEVTEDEYVENRIITDEAKLIFAQLDTNQDETLVESEFVENSPFEESIAVGVYGLFDTDGNGEVMVPEYLQVWGAWARGEEAP